MNRFSFKTFCVWDENRAACEICASIAGLKPAQPLPIVLLGDPGSGKTHLLCAIVNHVRKQSPPTALAYVTAKDFPADVRALAENPAPVTGAHSAILLVDQLERFEPDLLDVLGQIAPLFLAENRYLVFASKVHPADIENLPGSLLDLMKVARVASVKRPALAGRASENDPGKRNLRLQAEKRVLQHELETAHGEIARLTKVAANVARLEEKAAQKSVLEQEIRLLQRALEETRRQRDVLQIGRSAIEASAAELAQLQQQLAAATPASEVARSLQTELDQARQEARDARAQLDRWALRAQAILQQVEFSRVRMAENEEVLLQQVAVLQEQTAALQEQAGTLVQDAGEPANTGAADTPARPVQIRPWRAQPFLLPQPNQPGPGYTL